MTTKLHSKDAAKNITLNSLDTKGQLRIYEMVYNSSEEIFNEDEARTFRENLVKKDIHIRELTNQAYRDDKALEAIPGFMDVFEARYIDPASISYKTEVIIYNDVVAFYDYSPDSLGLEIFDANFASMQKQIFDQLWRRSSRPVIGRGGRSSLI